MMTPRERWLAAIEMKPVDRLPFWPKLDAAYPRMQDAPFCDMAVEAIHDGIGSDQHKGLRACFREVRRTTSLETREENGVRRTLYKTPAGAAELVMRFDAPSQAWHPVQFPVSDLRGVELMTEFFLDVEVAVDAEGIEAARARKKEIGDNAVLTSGIGESPLMDWVEWIAGVENAHYLLMDRPAEVERLFDAMHRVVLRKAEIQAAHSPADLLYMTENTSTTLISPAQYERYCARHIRQYGEAVAGSGKAVVLHMCGHLKALLPQLAPLPVAAFEAFTTPTLGNATLLEGRAACPDKCLIGGTNAMLWTRTAPEIIAGIEANLNELPHHRGLVVTSAGVMPPLCPPERIKQVCDWVKSYNARM